MFCPWGKNDQFQPQPSKFSSSSGLWGERGIASLEMPALWRIGRLQYQGWVRHLSKAANQPNFCKAYYKLPNQSKAYLNIDGEI